MSIIRCVIILNNSQLLTNAHAKCWKTNKANKKNASAAATTPVKVSRAPLQRKTCFLFIFACVSPAHFFGKTKVGHLLLWAIKRNMFLFFLLFVVIAVRGDRFVIFCFHCHSAVHENVTVPKHFCH